jgi:ribonuclease R
VTLPRVLSELVRSLKLNPELPDACEAEAAALVAKPGIDDPTLVDLTRLAFCTIDEPHSLDLDQALHVEPTVEGWRLHYAIADAAWFVRPDTALFDEALKRGATCYIPGLVVPMLPRSLSEGLVSLNPNVDRRALVFDVDVDRDGSVRAHRLVRGRIHSRAKLSYDGVQAWLDGGVSETDDPEVLASLRALVDMGKARLAEARSRNVLVVRRAEVDVRLDGLRFVALDGARNDVERYNEQVSLLCNILGAQRLARSASDEVQGVFRVHAPPEPIRMAEFRALTHTLAVAHERPELAWGDETLSAFVRRIPDEGPGVAVHRAALRTGGRSGYAPKPAMHHGVGAREYARFTAPMREVVGVFTHKEAWELVLGLPGTDDDEALRLQVIQSASRSHSRQRRVDKAVNRAVLDQVLADGKARSATLLEVSESRAVLRVDDPAIELNAYLRDLPGASVDGITLKLATGSARVGDPIEVRAIDVDAEADRWRISLTP